MKLENISIKNFRLLHDVSISLEDRTTVIVGRNNSGKTSLTELFERLLADGPAHFFLEDFTLSVHEDFWSAFILKSQGTEESKVREKLPNIEARLTFSYDKNVLDLGVLADFIIDLDPDNTTAVANIKYQLQDGKIDTFFEGIEYSPDLDEVKQKKAFFKQIKERITRYYTAILFAIDPTDELNIKEMEYSSLRALLQSGFINAQRRLDDAAHRERDVLGKVLERILVTAKSDTASDE